LRYSVVTSFSPEGWNLYGQNFVETFVYWPRAVKLICVWEGAPPRGDLNGFDLLETEPARSFFTRHLDDPIIAGKVPHPKWPWDKKSEAKGYNFRFDAYKFAHKVFALTAASRYVEDGKLFWLDADVITHAPVSLELLDRVLPDLAAISYLPRHDYTHSECGFIGFNLDHNHTRRFLAAFEDVYASDDFTKLEAWHDSFVFDRLVEWRKPPAFHLEHDSKSQPFDNSVLGNCMTHLKGRRKHGEPGWVEFRASSKSPLTARKAAAGV